MLLDPLGSFYKSTCKNTGVPNISYLKKPQRVGSQTCGLFLYENQLRMQYPANKIRAGISN